MDKNDDLQSEPNENREMPIYLFRPTRATRVSKRERSGRTKRLESNRNKRTLRLYQQSKSLKK
ncbi:hypothetical protein HanPSC8_Chr10g0408031 [Helianthus annuus]|nr:hypothetical protein HanPSC8_Chr10g0408031 [Helianthus annuus]